MTKFWRDNKLLTVLEKTKTDKFIWKLSCVHGANILKGECVWWEGGIRARLHVL